MNACQVSAKRRSGWVPFDPGLPTTSQPQAGNPSRAPTMTKRPKSTVFMNLVSSSDEDERPTARPRRSSEVVEISSGSDGEVTARRARPTKPGMASSGASASSAPSSDGEISEDPVAGAPTTPAATRGPIGNAGRTLTETPNENANAIAASSDEDGEVNDKAEQRALRGEISAQVRSAGKDVAERDARFFSMDDVVCSFCGTKGHLSYDCREKVEKARCHTCGNPGHTARNCPSNKCFHCNKTGHVKRHCPNLHQSNARGAPAPAKLRVAYPVRNVALPCYVCGELGHADCSLVNMPEAKLSCFNCGFAGHCGSGCREPRVEVWARAARDLEMERKETKRRRKVKPGMSEKEREKRDREDNQEYRTKLETRVREQNARFRRGRGHGYR